MIVGIGNKSCGDWSDAKRENGWPRAAYGAWLGGFMSGLNLDGSGTYGNLTDGTDFQGMEGWIDNYCVANPLDPVSSAATGLATELLRRKIQPH